LRWAASGESLSIAAGSPTISLDRYPVTCSQTSFQYVIAPSLPKAQTITGRRPIFVRNETVRDAAQAAVVFRPHFPFDFMAAQGLL